MPVVVVTGSAGLVGSEAVRFFSARGYDVVGIDNNMRREFFGEDACTEWNRLRLQRTCKKYRHHSVDIRDTICIDRIFSKYGSHIALVVHAAAQPSHDWAASDPHTDFTVNANGTVVLLEAFRKFCPEAVFIFCSTNKVYGDHPNNLPLCELNSRYEIDVSHPFANGIDETMSTDQCIHSVFGSSKLAADVFVQEYGRNFGLKTGVFRGGCLTGSAHSGTRLHGFLSYLMRCCILGAKYTIYGYKGKQVRDNIHATDLMRAFDCFFRKPCPGEVYNIGGSRFSHCSLLEAIDICESITGNRLDHEYSPYNRKGDHIWWISNVMKFQTHYPDWEYQYNIEAILTEIYDVQKRRADFVLPELV